MKKIVHVLCLIISVHSSFLHGMNLTVFTEVDISQLSKETIPDIVNYCRSEEKNILTTVNMNEKVRQMFMYTYANNIEMMRLLLENEGIENYTNILGMTPFHIASDNQNVTAIELLVDHGADVHKLKPHIQPLHEAVYKGEETVVKRLLVLRVNPDLTLANGLTPLCIASFEGHIAMVNLLLNAKANVNHVSNDGFTPLRIAVHNGHADIVQLLLNAKANVHYADEHGCTALHVASHKGNLAIVELLINAEASVNEKTKKGWTPLCVAVYEGNSNVVQLLLDNGANIHQAIKADLRMDPIIKKGDTPLQIAHKKGHAEIVKLLHKHLQDEITNDHATVKTGSDKKKENCSIQ